MIITEDLKRANGDGTQGYSAADKAREGLVAEGVPGASASAGATSVQEAMSVPVAVNPELYRGNVRKVSDALYNNPNADVEQLRPIGIPEGDERWESNVKTARELVDSRRKGELLCLTEMWTRYSNHRKPGQNADELKRENFSHDDKMFAGAWARMNLYRGMSDAAVFKATGTSSIEELGGKVIANGAMHARSPEEIARFFDDKSVSDDDAREYAQEFREMYGIPEEVPTGTKSDLRRYCMYYAQDRNAFYGIIAGRVADEEELRDAWALSLTKDEGARTDMLVNLSDDNKSLQRFARVVHAAEALSAYSDKSWYKALASGIWEGGKGAMRGIYTGAKDYFDKDYSKNERAKNWWAFVNKKVLALEGGSLGTRKEIFEKHSDKIPEWIKEFTEEEIKRGDKDIEEWHVASYGNNPEMAYAFGGMKQLEKSKAENAKVTREQLSKLTEQDAIDMYRVADKARRLEYALGQYFNMEQDVFAPEAGWRRFASGSGQVIGYMLPYAGQAMLLKRLPLGSVKGVVGAVANGATAFSMYRGEMLDTYAQSGDVTTSEQERQLAANLYGGVGVVMMSIGFEGATKGGYLAVKGALRKVGLVSAESAGVSFTKRGLGVWLSDALNAETKLFAAKYGHGLVSRAAQFTARFMVREGINAGIEGLEEGLEEALKAAAMVWVNEDAKDFSGAELLNREAIVESIVQSIKDGALYSFGMRGFYGLPGFYRGARVLGSRTISEDGKKTGDRVLSASTEAIVRTLGIDEAFRARIGGLLPKAEDGSSRERVVKTVREYLNADGAEARAKIRESAEWAELTESQKRKAEELAGYFDGAGESGKAMIESALIESGIGRYGGHGYTEKELNEARGVLESEFERNAILVQLREDEARLAALEEEFKIRQYEEAGSESAAGAVPRAERVFGLLSDDELWLERKLGATEIENTKAKLEKNSEKIKRSLGELRRTEEEVVRGFTGIEGFKGDTDSAKDLRNRLRAEYAALKKAGVESNIHQLTAKLAGFDLESAEEETASTRERARLKAEAEKAAKELESAREAAEAAERARLEAEVEERRARNAAEREKNAEYAAEREAEAERAREEARAAAEAVAEAEAKLAEASRAAEEAKRAEEAAIGESFDSERLSNRLKEREAAAKELISMAENHGLDDEALAKFAVLKGLADNVEEADLLVKLYRAGAVFTPEGIAGLAGAPMETVRAILRMSTDLSKVGKEAQEALNRALKVMAESGWLMNPSVAAVQEGNIWEKTFLLHLSRGDLEGLEKFAKMNARLRETIAPRREGLFTPTPFAEVDDVRIAYAAAALSFPGVADNSMRSDAAKLLSMTAAYPGEKLLKRLFDLDLNKKRLGWDLVTETAAAGDVEVQDAANERSSDFAGDGAGATAEKVVEASKKGDKAARKVIGEATVKGASLKPGESREFSQTPSALLTEGKNGKVFSARSFTGLAPYLIAGNKSAVIANNSALFKRIGEYVEKTGGRIFDLFGGSNIYFYSLDMLGALPKGAHRWNEWSTVRYVANYQIKENPEGVIAALESLVKRFLASKEWAEYERRIEAFNRKEKPWYKVLDSGNVQIGGNAQMVLVDWLRDELNGKHAGSATYLSKPGEDVYGVFLKNDARSAALYLFVQHHSTDNRPIGTIWKDGQAVFSHPPLDDGKVAEIGTGDITSFRRTTGGSGAGKKATAGLNSRYDVKNGEFQIARTIREASRVMKERGIEITQGNGWEYARTARRGDVVFIDPAYIGTQGYSKDNTDDSNPDVFFEKAKALIEYGNSNGVTYIFTNEYDLTGKRGEANFDEIYGKLARLTNKDGTPMVSVNRTVRSNGKAEIMIVNDGGAFLLNPSKADAEIIREKNPAMSAGDAVERAQEAKLENSGLKTPEDLAWARDWQKKQMKSVLMQRALSVFTEAGARRIEAQVRKFGGWLGRAGVKVRVVDDIEAAVKSALGRVYWMRTRKEYENNSGYGQRDDGTWASRRAMSAEEEGTFSKKRFCENYNLSKNEFEVLLWLGLIQRTEWHHEGKSFKNSDFYSWSDSLRADGFADYAYGNVSENSIYGIIEKNRAAFRKLANEFVKSGFEQGSDSRFFIPDFEYYVNDAFFNAKNIKGENLLTSEEIKQRDEEHARVSENEENLSSYERREKHKEIDARFDEIAKERFSEKNRERLKKEYDERTKPFREANENAQSKEGVKRGKETVAKEIFDLFSSVEEYELPKARVDKNLVFAAQSESKKAFAKENESAQEQIKEKILKRIKVLNAKLEELKKKPETEKTKAKIHALNREISQLDFSSKNLLYSDTNLNFSHAGLKLQRSGYDDVLGAYLPDTKEVIVSKGANADTLLHELGWHATFDWARENSPELYGVMREYALNAPEGLKRAVAEAYGHENGEISEEEFLDECGAAFFSEEHSAKVEAALDAESDSSIRGVLRRAWNSFRELMFKLWTRMNGTYERYWTADGKRKVNLDEILDSSKSVREQMSALADSFAKGQLLADYAEAKEAVEPGSTAVGDALAWAGRNRGSVFAKAVEADVSDIRRGGRRYHRPLERTERETNRAGATAERVVNSPDMEAFAARYEQMFRRLGMEEDIIQQGKDFHAHLFENIKASAEAVYTERGFKVKSELRLKEMASRKSGAAMSKAVLGLMRAYELPVLGSAEGGVIGWGRKVAEKLSGQTSDKALGLEALKRVLAAHYHRWAVRVLSSASAIKAEEKIERLDEAKDEESVLAIADGLEELLSEKTDKVAEAELRKGAKRMLEKYGRFYENRELTERKYEGGAERFLHLLAKYERVRASKHWEAEFEKRRTAYEGVLSHPGTTRVQKLEALAGMAALSYWWAKPLRDMSAAELIALTEKISEVETDGALAKRNAELEREEMLKSAWGKVAEAIKQSAAKKGGNPNKNAGWLRSGLNFGQSLRSKLESAIRFADKGTYEEAMEAIRQIDLLITEANNSAAAKVADDEYEFFAAILRYAGKESKISPERHGMAYVMMSRAAGNVVVELMAKAKGGEKFSADGKEKRTWLELMAQWLMMNQREWADMFDGKEEKDIPEASKAAFRKWKQQEELAEFLGEKRVELAQAVSKILQSRAEEIDAQSVKDTGVGLSYRRGEGYFPIIHELNSYMNGLRVHASGGVPSVVPKILTPRKHSRKDIDEHADLLSVFRRQIFDVAQYTAFGETGAGAVLRGIMEDEAYADMRKNVAEVLGANIANSVWRHMAQVLNGHMEGENLYGERDTYDKAFGVLRWLTRCMGLAYNLASGAKQVVGGVPAYVNAYGFRKTLLAVLKRPLPSIEAFKELLNSDGYVQRYGNNEMTRMLSEVRISGGFIPPRLAKMFMRAENNAMMFTAYGDRVPMFLVGTAIYTAMKNEYIAQGKTVAEATRLAQRDFWQVQDRTQQARHIQNADQISREGGEFKKMFVQFLTSPIQFVSDEIHAWEMAIARKDAAALRKLATVSFHNHVLQAGAMYLVELAVRALLGDDDDDWLTKRDVAMFVLGSWEAIPVFGSALESTMLIATGDNPYGSTMFAPSASETGTRFFTRLGKLVSTLSDGKDGTSTKAAMKLAESSAAIRYMHKTWNKYIADDDE